MSATRCPFAVWRGPIANSSPGGRRRPCSGLVLHVEVGTEAGTDSWFHNPAAKASADFGVAFDGTLHQWVDLDDKSWAESFYNPYWFSVETEGTPDTSLTDAQVATIAHLFAWLAEQDGFPLQVTDAPDGAGLITHGDLGSKGGGHIGCPGDLRSAQRQRIIDLAKGSAPTPSPVPNVQQEDDDMPAKVSRLADDGTYVAFPANAQPYPIANMKAFNYLRLVGSVVNEDVHLSVDDPETIKGIRATMVH